MAVIIDYQIYTGSSWIKRCHVSDRPWHGCHGRAYRMYLLRVTGMAVLNQMIDLLFIHLSRIVFDNKKATVVSGFYHINQNLSDSVYSKSGSSL